MLMSRGPALAAGAGLLLLPFGIGHHTPAPRPAGDWVSLTIEAKPPAPGSGHDGAIRETPLVPDSLGVSFYKGDRVGVGGGCGSTTGPLDLSGGRFRMTERLTTAIGCSDPDRKRYREGDWISNFLDAVPYFSRHGDRMTLRSADATVTLAPRQEIDPDRPLVGTRWTAHDITTGPAPGADPSRNYSIGAAQLDPPAELAFGAGRLDGHLGCATFAGPAVVRPGQVHFGDLVVGGCAANHDAARTVAQVLSGDVVVRIEERHLTLTDATGRGLDAQAQ